MKKDFFILFILLCLLSTNTVFAAGFHTIPQTGGTIRTEPMVKMTPTAEPVLPTTPENTQPTQTTVTPTAKPSEIVKSAKPTTSNPLTKIPPPLKIQATEEVVAYKKISLSEAISYALAHNLNIKSTRLNINIDRNNIKVATHLKNPYIQAYYNGGKAAEDNPNFFGMLFPFEIAKRGVRRKLAQSNLELTKGNVALAELNLRLDVRQAYVDLVAAKTNLKIMDGQRQLLQELLNIAQLKYNAGAVPLMDVIQAKMTLNQALIQLNSAKTDVLVARFKFNSLLDANNFDTKEDYLPEQKEFIDLLTPRSNGKAPTFDEIANVALSKRLDLKNALQDIDVAQKNLMVTIHQRYPDIEIGGGILFVPEQLATANRTTEGFYIAGNITNIPLFYQYTPEIKNAKLQIEQKKMAYDSLRHKTLLDLHSAYDSFYTVQTNLNYYNDILLSESRQFLNMSKKSYLIGKTSITDYIFIQQSYKNILLGYTNTLADYYDAWIDVLREVNDESLKLKQPEGIK